MSTIGQRALDYVELEWGTYAERFHRLLIEDQSKRLKLTDDVVHHDDEHPMPIR